MNIAVAREYANILLKAADMAEAEGRDILTKADIDIFAEADNIARSELDAAIKDAENLLKVDN